MSDTQKNAANISLNGTQTCWEGFLSSPSFSAGHTFLPPPTHSANTTLTPVAPLGPTLEHDGRWIWPQPLVPICWLQSPPRHLVERYEIELGWTTALNKWIKGGDVTGTDGTETQHENSYMIWWQLDKTTETPATNNKARPRNAFQSHSTAPSSKMGSQILFFFLQKSVIKLKYTRPALYLKEWMR